MIPQLEIPDRYMYATWEAWADAVKVAVAIFNVQLREYLEGL